MFDFVKKTKLSVDVNSLTDDFCRNHIHQSNFVKMKEINFNQNLYKDLNFFLKNNILKNLTKHTFFFGEKMLKDRLKNLHLPTKQINIKIIYFIKKL